jgi:hypothetical protein
MNNRTLLSLLILISTFGCGDLSVPQPTYHEGWEHLNIERLDWPNGCRLPSRPELFQDSLRLKSYACYSGFDGFDFSKWDVLMYNTGYDQVTDLKVGSYVYINHRLKKVRLEVVDRTRPNRSGLTSNGFTAGAFHCLKIPKVPAGYSVELTRR